MKKRNRASRQILRGLFVRWFKRKETFFLLSWQESHGTPYDILPEANGYGQRVRPSFWDREFRHLMRLCGYSVRDGERG